MLSIEETFIVPEEYVQSTPCLINPAIFTDKAFDVDIHDESWSDFTLIEQSRLLKEKSAAEVRAKVACQSCPVLQLCDEADRKMTVKAFGIIACRTYEERTNSEVPVEESIPRGPMGQVRDDLIERWTELGLSNAVIAQRLKCHPRTVERRKAGLASGSIVRYNGSAVSNSDISQTDLLANLSTLGSPKTPKRIADNPLQPSRVTPETAFIYNTLIDGAFHDRSAVLDSALSYVDRRVAYNRAPKDRSYPSDEARVKIGARKFLMNRVDIAVRSGRISEVTTKSGVKLISLEANTLKVWKNWLAKDSISQ